MKSPAAQDMTGVLTVTGVPTETHDTRVDLAPKIQQDVNERRGIPRLATFEEAIGLVGVGQFHKVLLLVSGMCVMSAVLETVVVGYLLPSAVCELEMSTADKGFLGAASYVGIVLSSHTWGLIADTKGRRTALLAALILDAATSAASCMAPNFLSLLILRLFCGVFSSAPAALSFAYLGEFHTAKTRSKAIIWTGAFPSVGLIFLPGVAWLILPQTWALPLGVINFTPWRLLILLCALTTLVTALLLYLLLPESPKFLVSRDPEKALDVLRNMYAANMRLPACTFPITELIATPPDGKTKVATIPVPGDEEAGENGDSASASRRSSSPSSLAACRTIWRQTAPLFQPPYLRHSLLVCFLQFGNLASANGLQIWLPDIFNYMARFSEQWPESSSTICQSIAAVAQVETLTLHDDSNGPCIAQVKEQVFVNNLIIGSASLATPLFCGMFVNKIGKKNLLMCCLAVTGVCGILLNVANSDVLVLVLSSVIVAINAMGIGHISSIVVDLFPTHLRAMAVSLSLMVGRSGSIAGNLLFGALLKSECTAAFYVLGGTLLACAAMSCTLPKRGKFAL